MFVVSISGRPLVLDSVAFGCAPNVCNVQKNVSNECHTIISIPVSNLPHVMLDWIETFSLFLVL